MSCSCRHLVKDIGLVMLGFGLATLMHTTPTISFGSLIAGTPPSQQPRRLKDIVATCQQEYLQLYQDLGDKLCDHGLQPGNGAYCRDPNHYLGADTGLIKGLTTFFQDEKANSVIDFGAGGGWYRDALTEAGLSVRAYDGAVGSKTKALTKPMKPQFQKNKEPFKNVAKLPLTFNFGDAVEPADWIYCIEVAEHVPSSFEQVLLHNLVTHATKGLILTWAVPGQPGFGHINGRPKNYVVERMGAMGFTFDEAATRTLSASALAAHLKQNLLVFRRH